MILPRAHACSSMSNLSLYAQHLFYSFSVSEMASLSYLYKGAPHGKLFVRLIAR